MKRMSCVANFDSPYHLILLFFFSFFVPLVFLSNPVLGLDLITPTQPLTKNQTIISSGDIFELGFFSLGNSSRWYVGIWYRNTPQKTYVWVANRDRPLQNSSGSLKIAQDGNIVLVDDAGDTVWSSNQPRAANTVAQLFDTGNFVLRREDNVNPQDFLWTSFDYPTDTLLPGMKLGWDSKTGLNRQLTSWKSADDPSAGDYHFLLDIRGFPECYLMRKEDVLYRSGPWNGLRFSGVPEMKPSPVITFSFVLTPEEIYYKYDMHNLSLYSRLVVNHSGSLQRFTWIETSKLWNLFWYARKDQCDTYKECGNFGVCDSNASPVCQCMRGFEPRNPQEWALRDGSEGCVREHKLDCSSDGFLALNNMKLPDSSSAFLDQSMSLEDCRKMCLRNCSCTAYANSNITASGHGCSIWTSDLVDLRQYSEGDQHLYVRVAFADADLAGNAGSGNYSSKTKRIIMVAGIVAGSTVILFLISLCLVRRRLQSQTAKSSRIDSKGLQERSQDFLMNAAVIPSKREYSGESTTDEVELPLFDFSTIAIATENFSEKNKLGQGGFGCVHKGLLVEGQEIAVKRLSKNSGQGIEEFKNEVRLIARLQHRNLVRLLGCCIDMEEKMLVYEYMEHKSLDSILFDKDRSALLTWKKRFSIVCGIARGLLYLHQDSRFRIIHRDLKASNILLDKEMNPKISDFGMARICGGDETEANTRRVVGTYGYMAPEYAMDGIFSVKSDVFSFGVLVLEIVSGKKNRGFYHANNQLNLLAHAWKLWREGRGQEVMDPAIGEVYSACEISRCIQVGLLCVQEQAEERPSMATVLLMLSSETTTLPQPKHPGFCLGRRPAETESSSSKPDESSVTVNEVTVTILDGR